MRSAYAVILLASCLALAQAFPDRRYYDSSESEDKNDDVVLILPNRRNIADELSAVDSSDMLGSWYPFRFSSQPFENVSTWMQETMNRLRSQIANAMAQQFGGAGGFSSWGSIPKNANKTSVTKIIGNHKVTINETTYLSDADDGAVDFRLRVVDIQPLNGTSSDAEPTESSAEEEPTPMSTKKPIENEEREELTTPGSRSVETVEEFNNELPNNQVDTLTA